MLGRVATIGVYGYTAERFFDALDVAGIDVLVDVRQRRGVRGAEYAWANSVRLQSALAERGKDYLHVKGLAPTAELRRAQYTADAAAGEAKRTRTRLSDEFRFAYSESVLAAADLDEIVALLAGRTPVLLCVERDAEACHRALVADRLAEDYGAEIVHLAP